MLLISMKKISKNLWGQGMMEVIVAIAIITTGITGTVTLTYSNLRGNETSINQIIAANLAREGLEVVRNIRDENWLQGNSWIFGLKNTTSNTTDYDGNINFDKATKRWNLDLTPNGISAGRLYLDSDGVYSHSNTGTITPYWRNIEVRVTMCQFKNNRNNIVVVAGNCQNYAAWNAVGIKVISQVQWQEKGQTKTYRLEENLYNWHDAY